MKSYLLIILTLIVTFISCNKSSNSEKMTIKESYIKIELARKNRPVDFLTIEKLYKSSLQNIFLTEYANEDKKILEAIESGKNGKNVHVNSQIISKRLQKIFFNKITKSTKSSKSNTAHINDYYEVLSPTVKRRGEWTRKGMELDDAARFAIKYNNGAALEAVLIKTYALSVLYEFEGIEKARGSNKKLCEEKVVEAQIFFEIISPFIANKEIQETLYAGLHKNYNDMDIVKLRALIKEEFKIN